MATIPELSAEIVSVFIGKVENRWAEKPPSAIAKKQTDSNLYLGPTGIQGDHQADLEVHGGLEKALHHYSADHMRYWRERFPHQAEKFIPGCFGENISSMGLNEKNLCIGDVLAIGTAKVEICQGRQPCWKLNAHMHNDAMASSFQLSARTGWYYRVLEPGHLKTGDQITLIDRQSPQWTIERVTRARFCPDLEPGQAEELASIPALSESWRRSFQNKINSRFKENTDARLQGSTR